ncbi:MAG: DUF485 domain-containing protein [Planctomycetaceae bacterium]|nr:DUF485 domain-containing protein [Planctomycetaceae bacterium]
MPHFDHGPNEPVREPEPHSAQRTKLGLVLFSVYLVLYGGFVLVNAFAPQQMEATPLFGINLAILYGVTLILAAFALAMLYGWLCRE